MTDRYGVWSLELGGLGWGKRIVLTVGRFFREVVRTTIYGSTHIIIYIFTMQIRRHNDLKHIFAVPFPFVHE
jgi:hypothetical protein